MLDMQNRIYICIYIIFKKAISQIVCLLCHLDGAVKGCEMNSVDLFAITQTALGEVVMLAVSQW